MAVTTIFEFVGNAFDDATITFITSTSARVISDFTPIAVTGIALFMTCYGYLIMAGKIEEPFKDFLFKCVKIIIIASLALNTATYLNWVVAALNGLESGLAAALAQTGTASTIYQTLDKTLDSGLTLVQQCFEAARNTSWTEWGDMFSWYIYGGLIAISTLVIVITGGVIILMAGLLLKLLFAVGPLFIMCLMWPATAKFFDAWFAQIMTYIFKIVFVATIMAFAVGIFTTIIGTVDLGGTTSKIKMMLEFLVAAFLLYKVTLEVGGVAAGLGSGVAAAAMSIGQLASSAMAPLRTASSVIKEVHNAIDPVSTRRDMQSGMLLSARRSSHILSGNTMVNPAYRQKLKENIGKNWGHQQGGSVKSG